MSRDYRDLIALPHALPVLLVMAVMARYAVVEGLFFYEI